MSNEQSTTEPVLTTTSTREPTQKAKESPDVSTAQWEDTSTQIPTKSEGEKSLYAPLSRAGSTPPEPRRENGGANNGPTMSTPSETLPTPSELVELGNPPLVVDLMGAHSAYNTFDIAKQSKEIDDFIRQSSKDSRDSYEKTFNNLVENIKVVGDIYTDMEQLYDYVKLQIKIQQIIKEKEEFEQKDPLVMTASELERYLKEHGSISRY